MPAVKKGDLVLLSGASGFLAVHVAKELVAQGLKVRGTVRSKAKGDYVKKVVGDNFDYVIVEDIGTDNAFDKAVEGVQGVAHTASPFHFNAGGEKGDPDEILIKPAVNGTTNILKAAKSHGKDVKRVVITSSFAAVVNNRQAGHKFTEDEWNQDSLDQYEKEGKDAPGNCTYRVSKTLAEKAAWQFEKDEKPSFDLATINPPLIWGPTIHQCPDPKGLNTSIAQLYSVLKGEKTEEEISKMPPGFLVDVRNVAQAHVQALLREDAGDKRFNVSLVGFTFSDAVEAINARDDPAIKKAFPKMPTGIKGDKSRKGPELDATRSKQVLGLQYLDFETVVHDTAASLAKRETEEWSK